MDSPLAVPTTGVENRLGVGVRPEMEGTYFRSRIEENMRRATQAWLADGRAEGIEVGRVEGVREGLEQQRMLQGAIDPPQPRTFTQETAFGNLAHS